MPGLFDDPPPKTVAERYAEECAATARLFPPVGRPGEAERDAAIAQVEGAADPAWLAEARLAALAVSRALDGFTTDDVWAELDARGIPETIHERRAMGAVMKGLLAEGLIVATDGFRQSSRAVCHRNPKRVWRRSP